MEHTPIERLANSFLLNSLKGQDGFVLRANDEHAFMSFFREGVLTESLDLLPKIAVPTQARLVEMLGFDGHRPQQSRLLLRLGAERLQPYVGWIRTTAMGERLTMTHYKNEAGEFDQQPFFEETERAQHAYLAKDFEGALESIATALTLTHQDAWLKSMALSSKLTALAGLGAVPPSEEAFVLQYVDSAFGARHPIALLVKADLASERLQLGQRDEALRLWQSVREPYSTVFGDDEAQSVELDALM